MENADFICLKLYDNHECFNLINELVSKHSKHYFRKTHTKNENVLLVTFWNVVFESNIVHCFTFWIYKLRHPYIGAIHTLSILGIDNFQHNNNNVFLLSHTILNWEDK